MLGITLGALWALQGLTGAALVFNRDLQVLALPNVAPRAMLPLDQIFERAGAAAAADISHVETFGPEPSLLVAYYKDSEQRTQTLVIDAGTGAVLDRRDPGAMLPGGGSSWRWLLRFHESLLSGSVGLIFVGTSGALLILSITMGVWVAWPRRAGWFQIVDGRRWRTTMQRIFGWHRMLGLTIAGALLVIATCGTYLAFATQLRPLLIEATDFRLPFKPDPVQTLGSPAVSAQQALASARARFPDAGMVRATLPTTKSPVYAFRLLQAGEGRRWAGTTTVAVDPASGAVVHAYDPFTAPLANQISDLIYPVHNGEVAGSPGRLLVMLAGLALPTLYLTGLLAWLRRRRRSVLSISASIPIVAAGAE